MINPMQNEKGDAPRLLTPRQKVKGKMESGQQGARFRLQDVAGQNTRLRFVLVSGRLRQGKKEKGKRQNGVGSARGTFPVARRRRAEHSLALRAGIRVRTRLVRWRPGFSFWLFLFALLSEGVNVRHAWIWLRRRQSGVWLLRGVGLVGTARKMLIDGTLNPKITKSYMSKQAWGFNEVISL